MQLFPTLQSNSCDSYTLIAFLFCAVFHHRGECSSVSQLSAGIKGNRVPPSLRGRQTSPGDAPAIIEELCYPGNHCLLWAQPGLCGRQDTKVGPLQVHQSKQLGKKKLLKKLYRYYFLSLVFYLFTILQFSTFSVNFAWNSILLWITWHCVILLLCACML